VFKLNQLHLSSKLHQPQTSKTQAGQLFVTT